MTWQEIVFISIYGTLLIAYMVCKIFRIRRRIRGPIKVALSALFVVAGIIGCILSGGQPLAIVLCVGLLFAALGDIFLIFMDKRKNFHRGVVAFGIANAIMAVYSILRFDWVWWSILVFAALMLANILCQYFKVYNYGKSFVYLNIYLVFVGYNGSLGLSILCGGVANLSAFLFGLGAFLFLISDILLGMHAFKLRYRAIDALNSLTYFSGLILIAASLFV